MYWKHTLYLLLLCFYSSNLTAQEGHYFLTNYSPSLSNIDNKNYAIAQDRYGQMSFANRKGVLKFDGSQWYLIETPSSAISLMQESEGKERLFVGCRNNFGFITQDDKGKEFYSSISDKEKSKFTGEFIDIRQAGGFVYFLSDDYLVEYSLTADKVTKTWSEVDNQNIYAILELDNQLFVFTDENKIYKIERSQLIPRRVSSPEEEGVVFTIKFKEKSSLVGFGNHKIYQFDGRNFSPFELEDAEYFEKAEINKTHVINDSLLLISTFRGGCAIVNTNTSKTSAYINYQTGLPDDEIYAVATDESGGIWITHEFGYTRADYQLPFRSFSSYYGLEGTVNAVEEFKGKLVAATSLGLFYLDEVKNYEEVEKVVRKVNKRNLQEESSSSQVEEMPLPPSLPENNQATTVDRSNLEKLIALEEQMTLLLSGQGEKELRGKEKRTMRRNRRNVREQINIEEERLKVLGKELSTKTKKSNNNKKTKITVPVENSDEEEVQEKQVLIVEYVKTTETSLASVEFVFKKLEGVEGKCTQIVPYNGKLLVASNRGLFEIDEELAVNRITTRDIGINYLHLSDETKRLWIATTQETVFAYNLVEEKAKSTWLFDDNFPLIQAPIKHILEEFGKRLWLIGSNGVFKIDYKKDKSYGSSKYYKIDNPYSDEVVGIAYNDSVFFVLSSGFLTYNNKTDSLEKNEELDKRYPIEGSYIHVQNNILWFQNKINWNIFSPYLRKDTGFTMLNLLGDIRSIHLAQDKRKIFVVTKQNQLYTFYYLKRVPDFNNYNLFLRQVTDKSGALFSMSQLQIDQEGNTLVFHLSNPYYLDEGALEYQYKLTGLSNERDWSDWGSANFISLNYLPSGKYDLLVRSRDIFGKTNELAPVSFFIRPPYWQRNWFYLLQIVVFSTLLFLSFRLNRTKLRNRVISKVLTYLTIILIFSYIETVAETFLDFGASPVYEFGVQVVIAVLIFPIERILTQLILKAKSSI